MSVDLDVLISTNDGLLDMKSGLETMRGVSNAVTTIVESVLTKKIPERKTAKDPVRTRLKRSFKGSYGQIFSVDVFDDKFRDDFNSISGILWGEVISYILNDALYLIPNQVSTGANDLIDSLGDKYDGVIDKIRLSCLKDIHQASLRFNENIVLRVHEGNQQIPIANFDRETAKVLNPIRSKQTSKYSVIITRLNIHTGNGRLQIFGEHETVAFGFDVKYKEMRFSAKKVFSENLDKNNGIPEDEWTYIQVVVEEIKLKSGYVIKYIIKSYEV
ncbi:MAG: hypothetical protein LBV14_15560 [Acidovorax sp.]|jgi:hypothetical protein|nr:hypothetical protein [Acidovorax sp.]